MAVLRLCCCDVFFLFVTSRATLELWCADFSLRWLLLLQSMGSRMCGLSGSSSWAPELRLSSCGARVSLLCACGVFWDQEWILCLLHWQVDSLPLSHHIFVYISIALEDWPKKTLV